MHVSSSRDSTRSSPEWEGNPGARDAAWAHALQLATAARDAESVAAIRLDRALARLAVHDAGALDDARAAGHDAVIARAAVAAGDCATGTAALSHAETRSPQLELAIGDWVARCLAVDATPWYRVAHASARSARDRRAELAALAELDPDAARELATRWRLPLALSP